MAAAKRREGVERLKAKGEAANLRAMVYIRELVEWRVEEGRVGCRQVRGVSSGEWEGLFLFLFSHFRSGRKDFARDSAISSERAAFASK